ALADICGFPLGSPAPSTKAFHDAILRQHSIPITMVRAILTNQPLDREGIPAWRFPHAGLNTDLSQPH
ncbi:MAG: hypothetical protein AAF745_08905, partial [Planctomycetota bacterium]